jgi:acrylyl-CoA reductase (NADPH)
MNLSASFRAFRIHGGGRDDHRAGVEALGIDELSPGEVVVRAAYSSIN